MARIEAPNKEYNGPGPGGAVFKDGVAETDNESALNYYRAAGYAVDGDVAREDDEQEPADPRDITDVVVGTRLRDAAVDPREGDFLAPIGAGEANPHGPKVVAPEIHGSGPAGILPGVVPVDNLGRQEQREKEFVEKRLLEGSSVVDASGLDLNDRGPIGLSDPGSAKTDGEQADGEAGPPAKSAPKSEWVDYAVSRGASRDDAEAATKADLIEQYS